MAGTQRNGELESSRVLVSRDEISDAKRFFDAVYGTPHMVPFVTLGLLISPIMWRNIGRPIKTQSATDLSLTGSQPFVGLEKRNSRSIPTLMNHYA